MTSLEEKFLYACKEMRGQRNEAGEIRWLYAVNWIVSCLKQENPDFDAAQFYRKVDGRN